MKLFGRDIDDILAYETHKLVRIRDKRLGLLNCTLASCIAFFIVGVQLLYLNRHFEMFDVSGTARLTVQQPTRRCNPKNVNCSSNFRSIRDLPYCTPYDGNSSAVLPALRHDCVFQDLYTMAPFGMLEDRLFVPTTVEYTKQSRGCTPSPANDYSCDNEWYTGDTSNLSYVADVERYTILITHSFRRKSLSGSSVFQEAFYEECLKKESSLDQMAQNVRDKLVGADSCRGKVLRKPIRCINDECPSLKAGAAQSSPFLARGGGSLQSGDHEEGAQGRRHSRYWPTPPRIAQTAPVELRSKSTRPDVEEWESPDIFAIPDGDVFKLSKLLELCGLSLDGSFNHGNESLRKSGTAIEIVAVYSNLQPFLSSFGYYKTEYTYKVHHRPMEEMKKELVLDAGKETRVIQNLHGLYIVVKVGGQFGFFSMAYMLVTLTTAVGLLALSVAITDKVALHLPSHGETYAKYKYEEANLIDAKDVPD